MIFMVGLVAIYGNAIYGNATCYAWWKSQNIKTLSSWEEIDAGLYICCDNKPWLHFQCSFLKSLYDVKTTMHKKFLWLNKLYLLFTLFFVNVHLKSNVWQLSNLYMCVKLSKKGGKDPYVVLFAYEEVSLSIFPILLMRA